MWTRTKIRKRRRADKKKAKKQTNNINKKKISELDGTHEEYCLQRNLKYIKEVMQFMLKVL
jgi:hypothetical protein